MSDITKLPLSKLPVIDIDTNNDLIPIIRSTGQGHYKNYLIKPSSFSTEIINYLQQNVDVYVNKSIYSYSSSFAIRAISSSQSNYATMSATASYIFPTVTSSYSIYSKTSEYSNSSSLCYMAHTSSVSTNSVKSVSASYADYAKRTDIITNIDNATIAVSSSYSTFAVDSISSSYSMTSISALTSSRSLSSKNSETASIAVNAQYSNIAINSNFANIATTAYTASYVLTQQVVDVTSFKLFSDLVDIPFKIDGNVSWVWRTFDVSNYVPVNTKAIHVWMDVTSYVGDWHGIAVKVRKQPGSLERYLWGRTTGDYGQYGVVQNTWQASHIIYITSTRTFEYSINTSWNGNAKLYLYGYYI